MAHKRRDTQVQAFDLIPAETDPRQFFQRRRQRHRERGPGQFRFTYTDIAQATQQALSTTRSTLRLNDSVRDVALHVARALAARSTLFTQKEVEAFLNHNHTEIERWEKRWPRFDLYHCGVEGCPAVLLELGLCEAHGGSPRPFAVVREHHCMIWIGRSYEPLCHVVLGAPRHVQVCHRDGNTWNNRHDNLEVEGWPVGVAPSRRKRWAYGYTELADLFGLTEDGVRQAVARKILDPASLESVCCFWAGGVEVVSHPAAAPTGPTQ